MVRPTAANSCLRVEMFEKGDGIKALASEANEIFPSFLPRGTSHDGPLIYSINKRIVY